MHTAISVRSAAWGGGESSLQLRSRLLQPATLVRSVEAGRTRADRTVLWDAVTFTGILLFTYVTHAAVVTHGLPWADAAMFFHFGHKLVASGKIPFRDYVFQVGPLPIYVDAAFQKVFGSSYVASLWAGTALKATLAFVVQLFAARWVNRLAGVLLAVFLVLDPAFAFQHHWSTPYALLFALLAIFAFCRAQERPAQRTAWLAASGAFVACIVSARQSGFVVATVAALLVTAALAVRDHAFMNRRALASFWGGFAGVLGVFAAILFAQGALVETVRALLLEAPAKKSVLDLVVVLDMLSGGALVEHRPPFTPATAFFYYNGLPLLVSFIVLVALRRRSRQDAGGALLLTIPLAIALTRISSHWAYGALDDLPRVFGMVCLGLAVVAPRTATRMLGIPASMLAMMLALLLALEAALEASYFGRGWVDVASMVALALLVGLRTNRIGGRTKTLLAAAFALVGVIDAAWLRGRGFDPFAKDDMFEGTLADARFESAAPAARGMTMDESKALVTAWLRERIQPGDSCFVYGTSSMLYDLLECENPSRLDITIADFFSERDGVEAVRALEAHPPTWIVAAETHWTNPDLATPFTGDDSIYLTGPNAAAAKVLHLGVQGLLGRYEVFGETSAALRPDLLPQAEAHPEKPHRFRLYRLRQAAR